MRLKGRDARRGALLRETARRTGCDAVLALAKVHETWSISPSEFDDPRYRRRRYGDWSESDDDEDAEPDDDYELDELIEQSVELECWIVAIGGARGETRFAFRPGLRGLRHDALGRAQALRLGVRGVYGQLRQHARSLVPPKWRHRRSRSGPSPLALRDHPAW